MLRHIRRSRFRPQMANGELVPGEALALQFNYRYTPDALTTKKTEVAQRLAACCSHCACSRSCRASRRKRMSSRKVPTRPAAADRLDRVSAEARLPCACAAARDTLIGVARLRRGARSRARRRRRARRRKARRSYPADLAALARDPVRARRARSAEDNYLKAIDLVEAAEGEFSIDARRSLSRPRPRRTSRARVIRKRSPRSSSAAHQPTQSRAVQRRAGAADRRHHDGLSRHRRHGRSAQDAARATRQRHQAFRRGRPARHSVSLSARGLLPAFADQISAREQYEEVLKSPGDAARCSTTRACSARCASSSKST